MLPTIPLEPARPPEAFRLPGGDPAALPDAYRGVDPAARGPVAVQPPRCVFIEVTNHCNLPCQTCPRTFMSYEPPRTLAWDDFVRVVAQFPDLERAVLHGIGEPLLNRELGRMIAYLKARGATVLFNTNATRLDDEWARALIASGLDELRCSLDAADPQTYARIRGAPLWHRVVANLRTFVAVQRELGAERPRVSLWMTGLQENTGQLPALVRLAAQLGVPEVYLQRLVYFREGDGPGRMRPEEAVFGRHADAEAAALEEAERVAVELGITLRASGASDPRGSLAAARGPDAQPWQACVRPWTTAYITANGNALPCCVAPFATHDYASLRLGNVFEQPFEAIWNDAPYREWRRALLSPEPHPACAGCGTCWSL